METSKDQLIDLLEDADLEHERLINLIEQGVSRNAVYQAERSEKEGAVSLKQME